MESKKKGKKSLRIYISIVIVLLLLQVIAWNSRSFSDAYIVYIFPIWVNIYGRITGSFPFSVGEWMIVAGIAVVISAVLLGISMIFPGCRHSARYCHGVKMYFRFFAWVLLFVFAIINALECSADDVFSDVINFGYKIKSSRLSDRLDALPPEEQEKALKKTEEHMHSGQ